MSVMLFSRERALSGALVFLGVTWAPCVVHAADLAAVNRAMSAASATAGTAVPSVGAGAVLQTLVALAVVIGLVFACAWLARRVGLQTPGGAGTVKVVAGASLGGKERVAVVEIGGTRLVLGVAPGQVQLLHTLPAEGTSANSAPTAVAPATPAAQTGTFGQRFRAALKLEAGKRLQRKANGNP